MNCCFGFLKNGPGLSFAGLCCCFCLHCLFLLHVMLLRPYALCGAPHLLACWQNPGGKFLNCFFPNDPKKNGRMNHIGKNVAMMIFFYPCLNPCHNRYHVNAGLPFWL